MKTLQDSDLMPFGKHKDKKMEKVPVSYLHWLWFEGGKKEEVKTCPVAEYIFRNNNSLKAENINLIW